MSDRTQYEFMEDTTPAPVSPYCVTCGAPSIWADAPTQAAVEAAGAVILAKLAEFAREYHGVIGLVLLRLAGDTPSIRRYADALQVNHSQIEKAIAAADRLGLSAVLRGNGTLRSQSQRERRENERARGQPKQ